MRSGVMKTYHPDFNPFYLNTILGLVQKAGNYAVHNLTEGKTRGDVIAALMNAEDVVKRNLNKGRNDEDVVDAE